MNFHSLPVIVQWACYIVAAVVLLYAAYVVVLLVVGGVLWCVGTFFKVMDALFPPPGRDKEEDKP